MPTKATAANENRFRKGALLLLFLALISAGSTAALYYGVEIPLLYSTALALPVVIDIALRTFFAGWIWMEKVRYYWYIGSVVFAGILAAIGFLCLSISLSGHASRRSFAGKSLNRVFTAFGMAQLMSARALSAFGLLFYLLDGAVSVVLVLASPQTFTPYYFFLLGNLALHLSCLTFLGYAFTASLGEGNNDGESTP